MYPEVIISISPKNKYEEYLVTPTIGGKVHFQGIYYSGDIVDAGYSALAMAREYRKKGYPTSLSSSRSTKRALDKCLYSPQSEIR